MKIAILGYGKMGKEIEKIALERGHRISLKVNSDNRDEMNSPAFQNSDVAIEFSRPETVIENINTCLESDVPVVVGTTGWYNQFNDIVKKCTDLNGAMLHATNFSVGVNIFFELNRALAKTMQNFEEYLPKLDETHHTEKLDAPSGTAITLAEGIIDAYPNLNNWKCDEESSPDALQISAHRIENVPGTHSITYSSEIDDIKITHKAHNRKGFALGAIVAAEWLHNRKGVYSMQDVLKVKFS